MMKTQIDALRLLVSAQPAVAQDQTDPLDLAIATRAQLVTLIRQYRVAVASLRPMQMMSEAEAREVGITPCRTV